MSYIITNLTMWAIRSPKGFGIHPHVAEKRCTLLLQATFGHTVCHWRGWPGSLPFVLVSDRIMIRRNNSAEFSSGLHGGINFRFKNWFRQKCRNNTISAEITFIRPKWGYFGRNYSICQTLPDLAYVSRLVRCVMQDGGRELIYLYGSHTSYWSNVGVEIATAYL